MCGIAGIAALDPRQPVDDAPLDAMLRCVEHRGPDDVGRHVDTGIALGHRRLSIIDPAGGHQPLFGAAPSGAGPDEGLAGAGGSNASGNASGNARTVIIANGEIYNFRELRDELRSRGHVFETRSDSEVAVHAYDEWELDCLERLDGMFALAVWDAARRRLVLARDIMGEKPLYWSVTDGLLVFGSELTAVLAHPAVPAELDPRGLAAYLAMEYVPAPDTLIRNVSKLEPGQALVLEDGEVRTHRYWRLRPGTGEDAPPYPEAVDHLRALLRDAVRSRLVSDVPLGVFLSGGIDSSAVAAFAAAEGALDTFSIGFEEKSFDERSHARAVAEAIGSRHHERVLRGEEMPDLVPRLPEILDEPIGDASILPTALLSVFAREQVTVALGGDGGDELFAGYPMHKGHRVAWVGRLFPELFHKGLRAATRRFPVSTRDFSLGFKVRTFLRGASAPPPLNHVLWMSSFGHHEQERLLTPELWEASGRGKAAFDAAWRAWGESEGAPLLARATHLDACTYLPGDILTKVDRASMAVALEVRAPFLARDVVEFAFSLPDAYRMKGLTGKRILRDALRGMLPESILERPKKGFGMPVATWLKGPLRPLAHDVLGADALRQEGLFDPGFVQRLLDEHDRGRMDHRKPLWTLLVFELWRRHHLGG